MPSYLKASVCRLDIDPVQVPNPAEQIVRKVAVLFYLCVEISAKISANNTITGRNAPQIYGSHYLTKTQNKQNSHTPNN